MFIGPEIETYRIGDSGLFISKQRVANNLCKLYFHKDSDSFGKDYIILKYAPYWVSPYFSVYFNGNDTLVFISHKRSVIVKKKAKDYIMVDTTFHYKEGSQSDIYKNWRKNVIHNYGNSGIIVYWKDYFDGMIYFDVEEDTLIGDSHEPMLIWCGYKRT